MGNGAITSNDLMQKLVNAKKVMNKVDGGNFERGHVNETILRSSPEDVQNMDVPAQQTRRTNPSNDPDLINKSKLPDNIKKAMIENPIPQISLSETLDMDFVNKAKNLMREEGVISSKPSGQKQAQSSNFNSNIDMNSIATLIENTVRKVMDEKLNQILVAHQTSTINENLVLKVGDSVFKGKITGVNKAK